MCASSSTTRIFEVIGAIASIDHRAVSALSRLRDRNVNSPRGLRPGAILVRAQDQLQRVPGQPKPVADLFLQVSPVGEMQEPCVVDEKNDRRRLRLRLGRVAETKAPAVVARRWMLHEGLPEDL